jgi:hypothetical protein
VRPSAHVQASESLRRPYLSREGQRALCTRRWRYLQQRCTPVNQCSRRAQQSTWCTLLFSSWWSWRTSPGYRVAARWQLTCSSDFTRSNGSTTTAPNE